MTRVFTYKTAEGAARRWAKDNGLESRPGGWIYWKGSRRTYCQGYGELARRLVRGGNVTGTWKTGFQIKPA
jgi:hypothetical protein